MAKIALFLLVLGGIGSGLDAYGGTERCLDITKDKEIAKFAGDQICFSQPRNEKQWVITMSAESQGTRHQVAEFEYDVLKKSDGSEGFEYREYGMQELEDSLLSGWKIWTRLYDDVKHKGRKIGEVGVGPYRYYAVEKVSP